MSDRVLEDDVRYVASLAHLALDQERVAQLVRELNGILVHMDELARVDTSQVVAFVAEQLGAMPLREDVAGTSTPLALPRGQLAPELADGFFLVPRLATHEDSGVPAT